MARSYIALCMGVLFSLTATPLVHASRVQSKPVPPVELNGVRYCAPNDRGRVCYVQAWDVQTGTLAWERIIYEVPIDPKLEEDVQWDFIAALSIQDGSLIVRTEGIQTYVLDLKTKGVSKKPSQVHPTGKHIVQAGESLSRIALIYHVSVEDLVDRNHIRDADKIVAGQELVLPVSKKQQGTGTEPAR